MSSPSALRPGVAQLSCISAQRTQSPSCWSPGLLFALSPFFHVRWIVGKLSSKLGRKKKVVGEMNMREENVRKETAKQTSDGETQKTEKDAKRELQ